MARTSNRETQLALADTRSKTKPLRDRMARIAPPVMHRNLPDAQRARGPRDADWRPGPAGIAQ